MQEVPFKLYNASAGSGKTYILAKTYLKIILSSKKSTRQILAITFTNKAVSEMKGRILDSLFNFSLSEIPKESLNMFTEICHELRIEADALQTKAKSALKEILHNYSFFDVSTIDKFNHRLIRTFARDLKLPQNFEVILDKDLLLEEAVAHLIDKAGTDENLTEVLINFALEKIEDDKSWDISFDLKKIGKLLFDENQSVYLEKLRNKEIGDFLKLRHKINLQIKTIEQAALQKSMQALSVIREEGFEHADFPRETLPNHFKKIKDSVFAPPLLYKNKLEENLAEGKILKVGVIPTNTLASRLLELYLDIKKDIYTRAFLKNAYNNLVPLTVLNAIQKEVKAIQVERDQLSISQFNTLISAQIKDQPAPFIYERLGEKYRHYFVDEFQDTSTMQWENLIPLIGNALQSEDLQGNRGSLFLVGDAKQAIYRWRGGRAEQFLDLVNSRANAFGIPPIIETLPQNFRSHEEIVKFNNDFFSLTSAALNDPVYKTLFIEGNKQKHTSKSGGVVQLDFVGNDEAEKIEDGYCREVLNTLQTILHKNYQLNDIAILVRENKHGVLLADFLTRQGIPIISPDSLLINSSAKVKFLVHVLQYCSQPDVEISYRILSYLAPGNDHKHSFIQKHLLSLPIFIKTEFGVDLDHIKRISVYDGLEQIIKQFQLVEDSDAHITYFMDVVFEVAQREGTGITSFLSFWERKKDHLGISAPENGEAVQIMSVHKAKGLEFPIVIFPFANSHIYKEIDPKLWLPILDGPLEGFTDLLLSKKQEVAEYGPRAKAIYEEEQYKLELDALNILYVALTRAKKALFVISENDLTGEGEPKMDHYSGFFVSYLKQKGLWDSIKTQYSFGNFEISKTAVTVQHQENIPYIYTHKERAGFKILANSGVLWDLEVQEARVKGNLLHSIMGLIETEENVMDALGILLRNGDLGIEEAAVIERKIHQIVKHEKLHEYYQVGNRILNEREIITGTGVILRPDRIILRENKATVIDYKTGKRNVKYSHQIMSYADALRAMGYEIENMIIVYINDKVELEFIEVI